MIIRDDRDQIQETAVLKATQHFRGHLHKFALMKRHKNAVINYTRLPPSATVQKACARTLSRRQRPPLELRAFERPSLGRVRRQLGR
eukprot:6179256-Pleurochrysis_carterae.AAC.1